MKISKSILLLLLSVLFTIGYQNCADVNVQPFEVSNKVCTDEGTYQVYIPIESSNVFGLRKFINGEPTDVSDKIVQITLNNLVTDRLPEVADCSTAYNGSVTYKNACNDEIQDNFTFSDPRCLPPPPSPTPPPPPSATTATIPGWTHQPGRRCDPSENAENGLEPPVPIQCVQNIEGLQQGYVRLPYDAANEMQIRLYRNMNYNYLHSGSCERDGSIGTNDLPVMNPNEFYSFRFTAESLKSGQVDINSLGIGSITISECPGDFGHIIEDGQYEQSNAGSNIGSQKTLHVYTQANDENINRVSTGRPIPGLTGVDRCVFRQAGGVGVTVRWYANDVTQNRVGCQVTPGKTYYLNIAPRHYLFNTPLHSVPFRMTSGI